MSEKYHRKLRIIALGITELVTPFGIPKKDENGNYLALPDDQLSEQERIDQIVKQTWINGTGALAIPAHPNNRTYPWTEQQLDSTRNYQAMEIFTGVALYNSDKYADHLWDYLLRENKVVWGVAADDYTPGILGRFGPDLGCVVIPYGASMPEKWEVLKLIRQGAFYSATGSNAPKMKIELINDNVVRVYAPQTAEIHFITQDPEKRVISKFRSGEYSDYTVRSGDRYVRVEVREGQERSWSQPIFFKPPVSAKVTFSGQQALSMESESSINISEEQGDTYMYPQLPDEDNYPLSLPSEGVVGYPYFLDMEGVSGSTTLTINYNDDIVIPFLEDSLAIFYCPQEHMNCGLLLRTFMEIVPKQAYRSRWNLPSFYPRQMFICRKVKRGNYGCRLAGSMKI
ncbi:MAG: hypothetical protein KGZ63_01595 [Clostridiales bacterium]|nr:hypothetical protein [Clostridiales bacterium]